MDEDSVPPKRRKYRPNGYADHVKEDGTYVYGRWRNENPANEKTVFQNLRQKISLASSPTSRLTGEEVVNMYLDYFVDNPVSWQWSRAHLF
jgi:hypothetical protein